MGKTAAGSNGIMAAGKNALPETVGRENRRHGMSEENIKRFYETFARIISEREQVKVTVTVRGKGAVA